MSLESVEATGATFRNFIYNNEILRLAAKKNRVLSLIISNSKPLSITSNTMFNLYSMFFMSCFYLSLDGMFSFLQFEFHHIVPFYSLRPLAGNSLGILVFIVTNKIILTSQILVPPAYEITL